MTTLINRKGFTLVEVVAAIAVFAIGMLALYRLQAATVVSNSYSNELTLASVLAQDRMEALMVLPYNDPALDDTDNDGGRTAIQDTNVDGVDDVGPDFNFGLNDTVAAGVVTADACITVNARTNAVANCAAAMQPGLDYRIYHNIAVNQPVDNTKTIRVIATWLDNKNILHRSSFTSMKAVGF